jgi:hypothetical protein
MSLFGKNTLEYESSCCTLARYFVAFFIQLPVGNPLTEVDEINADPVWHLWRGGAVQLQPTKSHYTVGGNVR